MTREVTFFNPPTNALQDQRSVNGGGGGGEIATNQRIHIIRTLGNNTRIKRNRCTPKKIYIYIKLFSFLWGGKSFLKRISKDTYISFWGAAGLRSCDTWNKTMSSAQLMVSHGTHTKKSYRTCRLAPLLEHTHTQGISTCINTVQTLYIFISPRIFVCWQ